MESVSFGAFTFSLKQRNTIAHKKEQVAVCERDELEK